MNELREKKIRFSDAAHSIGVTKKTLRNWLQRYDLSLISNYQGPQWTEFTMGDIAVLAVMRQLAKWGVSVKYANEIAYFEILSKAGPMFEYRNTPAKALIAGFQNWDMYLFGEDENGDPTASVIAKQDYLPRTHSSFIFLNMGRVISDAYERLEN